MKKDVYELTNSQKSIWLTEHFCPGTSVSTIGGCLEINEIIDVKKLEKAINIFVKENDAMRTRIFIDKKENVPKQYFIDYKPFKVKYSQFSNQKEVEKRAKEIASTPIELIEKQLYSFEIYTVPNGTGGFFGYYHHIICDAWTISLLCDEIMRIYKLLCDKKEITVQMPSYIECIKAERDYLESNKFQKSKEFWNNNVFAQGLDLTFIKRGSNSKVSYEANRMQVKLSVKETNKIKKFCDCNKSSIYTLFIAALGIYLSKINGKDSAIIGSPILNRLNAREKNTIGMFISTIPLKLNLNDEFNAIEYINSVSENQFAIFRNQKYPYQILLEDLRSKYDISQNVYDVALSYQNAKLHQNKVDLKYNTNWIFNGCVVNNLDIHIFDMNDTGRITINYDYRVNLFTKIEIKKLHERLLKIVNDLIDNPYIKLKDRQILLDDEKQYILYDYNNTNENFDLEKTVYQMFEEQVLKTPNNIAIGDGETELTYSQLRNKVYEYHDYLKENNISRGDKVCLFLNNSIELVTSILAVLSLGACYIPIDIKYPFERIKYILDNSKAKCIITNQNNIKKLKRLKDKCILVEDITLKTNTKKIDFSNLSADDLAYIIYTSGSTGNPKGVKIKNRSLTNYICFANKNYVHNEKTNFALYSSISFDLTVTSVFTPIVSGNAIYIYENENMQLLLKQIVDERKVELIKLTPAHLTLLLELDLKNTAIRKLILGGDNLPSKMCKQIKNKIGDELEIYNEYGPTEATVGCMIYKYQKNDKEESVSIGRPASNSKIFILNEKQELLPIGVEGEMYISGKCLSDGYLGLDNINSERFIKSPFDENEILYKTGDLAELYYDEKMKYLGRKDFQVKINGYRIEIGEIQSKLLKYPGIKDCYINVTKLSGFKTLCAYYVSNRKISNVTLRAFLNNYLPHYMLPKFYIEMDEIPLTTNGKIDKSRLPLPSIDINEEIVKPKTKIEKILCKVFCEVLNVKEISTETDFFNYYIDSLTIIKIQTILYGYGYNVNTQMFYEYPNIKKLAEYISKLGKIVNSDIKEKNEIKKITEIKRSYRKNFDYNNVLLFGATGFLGIHILYYLLKNTKANVYCLIRPKDNINPKERIKNKIKYYFDIEEMYQYMDRIHVIQSNILEEKFDVSTEIYEFFENKIDIVIDSVAIVKHYGNYKDFDEINVKCTKRIIDFCMNNTIPLNYISTMSVSGYGLVKAPNVKFTEDDFYIGQEYKENVYVRSKFEAERMILESSKDNNLIAKIYRVGNITNSYKTGKFQENVLDNAFINRLLAFINLGCVPRELLDTFVEFTPVDNLAKFIVELSKDYKSNIEVYHLFNQNCMTLNELKNCLIKLKFDIDIVSLDEFEKLILNSKDNYFGISNYLTQLSENSNIQLDNSKTNKKLEKLNLSWDKINLKYIEKIIENLKNLSLL